MHCTCHRVFLATLIVAAKYLNDQSPKNKHWSAHSSVFSVGEVNLMEKQLLSLLDFDLRITEADLASSLQEFMRLQQQTSSSTLTSTAPSEASSRRQGGAEIQMELPPQEHFKRRTSLPNQPCLEEGEVMPVYKGPMRNNQNQYPSPDGATDGLAPAHRNDDMTTSSSHTYNGTDAYATAQKAWMTSAGGPMYNSAPNPRLSHMPPAPMHPHHPHHLPHGYAHHQETGELEDNSQPSSGRNYGSSRAMC
ncbi:hypothetical protein BGZ90_000546 [Linnemannia elongata]|nr:hypothetical protein BGZ90_000546 [Linnemannia elongata]